MSSRPTRCAIVVVALTCLAAAWAPVAAQIEAETPTVRGVVMLGAEPLGGQPMSLHRVSADAAGEVATTDAAADGGFSFELPRVPGATDEVFFVSTRYQGILYFGAAVTDAASLDSLHTLQVYDTLGAPAGGYGFTVSARNVFVEEIEAGWQITDVFELENPGVRTVISGADGVTWSYPLMTGAANVELGEGDLGPDVFAFEEGTVQTSAPVPPGVRLYVFRYTVSELVALPLPGSTTRIEVLVREPASPFTVAGLRAEQPVELEPGSTFRRYVADGVVEGTVTFADAADRQSIPLAWMVVALALSLGLLGVWGVTRSRPATSPRSRAAILLEVAHLDEKFERIAKPTAAQRRRHERARDALLRGLPTD